MSDAAQLAVLHVLNVDRLRSPSSSTGTKSGISLESAGHARSSTMASWSSSRRRSTWSACCSRVYVFIIDVSHAAIQSGMVANATRTILESLDRTPNEDSRTKVVFITFNVSLYFFSLPIGTFDSSILLVSDLDEVFLPKSTDLLVNLTESRPATENLLGRLTEMFQENHNAGRALGPALQAAFKIMVSDSA